MAQTSVNIRMDTATKKSAEELFAQLGMNMTTAFNIFVRQSLRVGGIPFNITTKTGEGFYNPYNQRLLREAKERMDKGIGKPEPLKHELSGYYSRRIDEENRLVYTVENDMLKIIQCRTHYEY